MKGFPYVPWYHGDFLRSTAGWSLLERAAYWMLLCAEWESGPLPEDRTRLAAIAGVEVRVMESLWPVIKVKFTRTQRGLVNKRMEKRRADYLKYRKGQADRGKKGGAARWGTKGAGNVIPLRSNAGTNQHE
jgi:uncharacterized protein YdaU (DUF1376 family)